MSVNPSFLSQYHSFKLCLGCWHPAVCFQAQPASPGVKTAEALLPLFTFMPLDFTLSVLRAMFTAYFSAGGDAGEWRLWGKDSPNWEDGSELKRAAVALLLGKEDLNLVKHVIISSEKSGLRICTEL